MPRTPPKTYDVVRAQDGALIGGGASLSDARAAVARLTAEARIVVGQVLIEGQLVTEYAGMFHGEITRYEIRSKEGLVIR